MLSSFFSSSKPIHHLIFIGMLLAATVSIFISRPIPVHLSAVLWGIIMMSMAGMFQFIVSRNELTKPHAYASLFFVALLIGLLPLIYGGATLYSLFFILLGLRRLLSLRSGVAVVNKIFDASFWLSCAAVITPGAFLYLILIFLAILFYAPNDYRHWLTPFLGFFCTIIFVLVAQVYLEDFATLNFNVLRFSVGDWSAPLWNTKLIVPSIIVFTSSLFVINYLVGVLSIQQRVLPRFTILAFFTLITLTLIILKGRTALIETSLLLIPVAALFVAQVIERTNKTLYKELIILFLIALIAISTWIG